MAYIPGQPQNPTFITLDGFAFYIRQNKPKGNKLQLVMEPFDWVIGRKPELREELEFEEEKGGSRYGTIKRTYDPNDIVVLSNNPEKPIWLLMRGLEGDKVNWENPAIFPLSQIVEEKNKLKKRIEGLEAEVDSLTARELSLLSQITSLTEKLTDMRQQQIIVTPEQFVGTKVKTKE